MKLEILSAKGQLVKKKLELLANFNLKLNLTQPRVDDGHGWHGISS
jgi:hypothetical protein